MMQDAMTIKILREIFEKLNQKIVATVSTVSVPANYKVIGILCVERASRK